MTTNTSIGSGISINEGGQVVVNTPPAVDPNSNAGIVNALLGPLAPKTTPVTPTTTTVPPPTSQFGSSALPVIQQNGSAAQISAAQSLNTPVQTTQPKSFSYNGNQFDYANLPQGMTTTPPTGQAYSTIATPFGPVFLPTGQAQTTTSGGGTSSISGLPTGAQSSTDAQGNTIVKNANGQTILTVPSGGDTSKASTIVGNATAVQGELPTGYNVTASPDGNLTVTDASGQTFSIGAEAAGDPQSRASAIQQINSYEQTNTANTAAAAAQIQTLTAQYNEQKQQLEQEADAAMGSELGALGSGVLGSGGTAASAVKSRYDQLQSDLLDQFNASVATVKSNAQGAAATAASNLANAIGNINSSAQQTQIGIQNTAQTSFLNTSKTFDVSTANMPAGQSLNTLSVNSSGTTGVPAVDALIQQGVAAGYTPQQSLALVQAGVATQNKNNQAQFLGLLQQASYANGWSSMTTAQLQADPLYNAYVGMAQTYIPSLAGNPAAAQALVQGGTLAQQKLSVTTLGTPDGTTPTGQGGGAIGTVDPSVTNDPTFQVPGTGGYTQSAIDNAATQYNADGKMPAIGLGSSGTARMTRVAILNRAAQMNPNGLGVIANQSYIKGLQTGINRASSLLAPTQAAATKADAQIDIVRGLANKVDFGSDIIYNKATGTYDTKVSSNADVTTLVSAMNTLVGEYGKVQSGNVGAGGLTDAGRQAAADTVNAYMSNHTLNQVLDLMSTEMTNTITGYQDVIAGNVGQIDSGGYINPTSAAPTDTSGGSSSGSASIDSSFWGN